MKKKLLSITLTLCMLLTLMPTAALAVADLKVTVIWDDNNNQHGIRPDSVTITLLIDGEEEDVILSNTDMTESGTNEWYRTFIDIEYEDDYSVSIKAVDRYTSQISGSAPYYTITMTHALPTAVEYAAASPAATPGTDYVLDTDNTTLHIKTAKGAAWWSASGADYLDYTIKLANDIDVSAFKWMPVGTFIGTFDGQGHSISELNVRVTAEGSDVAAAGLFRKADGAAIKNMGLIDASVVAAATIYGESYSPSASYSGVFAAEAANCTFTNCFASGNVAASGGVFSYAGGFVGSVAGGLLGSHDDNNTFSNCYNACSVSSTGAYGANYACGMIGVQSSDSTSITNCFSLENCATGTTTSGISGTSLTETLMKAAAGTTDALIDLLNSWVTTTASADYYTWVADNATTPTNSGYPVFGPAWVAQAKWGVAGAEDAAPDTWFGNGSLTYAVAYANSLDRGTAYIRLLDNVDTTATLEFAEDKTTVLDLNGKTIDGDSIPEGSGANRSVLTVNGNLTLCDSSTATIANQGKITGGQGTGDGAGGGIYVDTSGIFIMTGGNITGNTAVNGGGVGNEGAFYMTGGSIAGNSCISGSASVPCGGGVANMGDFHMSGGSITGNTVAGGGSGGGVFTEGMTLSGNVNICGNTVGTASDNVALLFYSGHVPIIGITDALTNSIAIGVSIVEMSRDVFTPKAGVFTAGEAVINSDYNSKFVSDNSEFAVIADGSQLKLAAAQAITKVDTTNGSFTVKVNGNEVPSAIEGQTVTFTPTADTNYELDTITVTKTGDAYTPITVSDNTFIMPAYAVTINVTFKASAATTPTASEYAMASPAAASGTDYTLDDINKTLTIKTAKGAAWWSTNGANYLSYTVKLTNNIDVSAFQWTPVGTSYSNAFTGTFDGQGHTISGLTVNVSSDSDVYAGLFGFVFIGTVENVTVSGSINATSTQNVYSGGITGTIIGKSDQLSYLKNCISNVTVNAEVNDAASSYKFAYAGGLAASHIYTHTINCVNTGSVNASNDSANGRAYAGGLAGRVSAGSDECVNNSYNTGAVTAAANEASGIAYAGGITGALIVDALNNCYNTGTVKYTGYSGGAGGVAGYVSGGTIVSCYYLESTATMGIVCSDNGTATGCGTFRDNYRILEPGRTAQFGSDQVVRTGDILTVLNWWVNTTAS